MGIIIDKNQKDYLAKIIHQRRAVPLAIKSL